MALLMDRRKYLKIKLDVGSSESRSFEQKNYFHWNIIFITLLQFLSEGGSERIQDGAGDGTEEAVSDGIVHDLLFWT
jgi:hypothetical protein